MAEQNGTTQIVYSLDGSKLALFNGTNLLKAFVPLPGGAQAVYTYNQGSVLSYFRHPDWGGWPGLRWHYH
jgi:hypothetical protein